MAREEVRGGLKDDDDMDVDAFVKTNRDRRGKAVATDPPSLLGMVHPRSHSSLVTVTHRDKKSQSCRVLEQEEKCSTEF